MTKDELNRITELSDHIRTATRALKRAYSAYQQRYPHGKVDADHIYYAFTSELKDARRHIERCCDEREQLQESIRGEIEQIPDDLTRKVFVMRYLNCYTWSNIGAVLCYDPDYMQTIARKYIRSMSTVSD